MPEQPWHASLAEMVGDFFDFIKQPWVFLAIIFLILLILGLANKADILQYIRAIRGQ